MSTKSPLPKGLDDPQADLAIFGGPGESPERILMVAVLQQAQLDLFYSNKRHSEAAYVWFHETDARDASHRPWLFSFQNICEQLDLDADVVRRGILQHQKGP